MASIRSKGTTPEMKVRKLVHSMGFRYRLHRANPLIEAGIAGILIGMLVWFAVVSSIKALWLAALLCLIAGLLCNIPGAALVKLYRWLRNHMMG